LDKDRFALILAMKSDNVRPHIS